MKNSQKVSKHTKSVAPARKTLQKLESSVLGHESCKIYHVVAKNVEM